MPESSGDAIEQRTVRRVVRRIVPFVALLFVVNFLDRTNVGFAALTMNTDIGIGPRAYSLGAGIFFIGYFLFEIPSNVLLHRFGPRVWIARIMITWGLVATAMGFLRTPAHFLALRLLLGLAEAGFFPGVVFFLGSWIPRRHLAATLAAFYLGAPISQVIGAPLSTSLMEFGNRVGWPGWRLMFVCEGVPAILLGIVCLFYLTDTPAQARWLANDEREWLLGKLDEEERAKSQLSAAPLNKGEQLRQVLCNKSVWVFALIYFGLTCGSNSMNFLLPSVLQSFRASFGVNIGLLLNGAISALPYAAAAVAMVLWTRRSDRLQERRWHAGAGCLLAAIAIIGSLFLNRPAAIVVGFILLAMGVYSALNVFWTIPRQALSGLQAAAGIALINSIGNLSGFVGPNIVNFLYAATHSYTPGFLVIGVIEGAAGVALLLLPRRYAGISPQA